MTSRPGLYTFREMRTETSSALRDIEHGAAARREMVERGIVDRGICDPRVIQAMLDVPRHLFLPEDLLAVAHSDSAVSIGHGATISQPYIVALMTELLEPHPDDTVLEVGTGSGYQAAVLSVLVAKVVSIERILDLAKRARSALDSLKIGNVDVEVQDGTLGGLGKGPFEGILVTAGSPAVPEPLRNQLKDGGRLVIPVGDRESQRLIRLRRIGDRFEMEDHGGVVFVPLVGQYGWPAERESRA